MMRLLGVITGSALAIGLLLLLLGVPELGGQSPADRPVADAAGDEPAPPLDAPQAPEPVAEAITETVAEAAAIVEPVAEPQPAAEPQPVAEPEAVVDVAASPEPIAQDETVDAPAAAQSEAAAQNWYAFWSPFRSRIAADGFVSELSRTTGLDYRVVKLKPGVFEVAFAYTDDADIEDKLARISAATGLEMSGG